MKGLKINSFLVFIISIGLYACTYDSLEDEELIIDDQITDSTKISFASQVKPIFETKCAFNSGCHGSGASGRPVFETYAVIKQNVDNGKINNMVFVTMQMPKGSTTLTQNERIILKTWMEQGAPNN